MAQIEQHELELPPDDIIERQISNNYVTVFAKKICPDCERLKEFFKSKSIEYKAVDLDTFGTQGEGIQARLKEMTGVATVPSVWVNKKFIGKKQ